jgi:hypothetical protein
VKWSRTAKVSRTRCPERWWPVPDRARSPTTWSRRERRRCRFRPAGLVTRALGFVVNWPTALAALKLGRVTAGETVLIHAAAGATGQAALTPFRDWQSGRTHCVHLLARYVLGAPGDWKMVATSANGQPAAAVYRRDVDGTMRANGIVVLTATTTGVSRVVAFHHDPALVALFR